MDFLDDLPPETRMCLRSRMKDIAYRGLLADWGYSVPLDAPHTQAEIAQASSKSTPSIPPRNLPPTSPISPLSNQPSESGEDLVPVRVSILGEGKDWIVCVPVSELKDDHEIVLSMGRDSSPDQLSPLIDTNPLFHTVSPFVHKMTNSDTKVYIGNMAVDGHRTRYGWPWKTRISHRKSRSRVIVLRFARNLCAL